jgi:transcriptional regulator of heat shock response
MLTERQINLLNAIIREHIESSEPVGSQVLVKKYNLRYSAATVRNEMAKLLEEGFLDMLHTSSGRVPTPMAYKLFLKEMMEEEELPVLQEVALKQRLWPNRFEFEKMLRQAVIALADITKELAIATTDDGHTVHAGAVNVLDSKEFWDIEVARTALHLLDRHELLQQIFQKAQEGEGDIKCLIGEELGHEKLGSCGIIFTNYSAGKRNGYIALLGPSRMKYQKVIPAIRYTKKLIEELGESW